MAGCDYPCHSQVAALRPTLHVFGHTHIPIDLTLDPDPTGSNRSGTVSSRSRTHQTRFLQWPLGYPKEHRRQTAAVAARGPLLVWRSDGAVGPAATGAGGGVPSSQSYGFADGATPGAANGAAAEMLPVGRAPPAAVNERLQPPVPTYWGDYYRAHARDAGVTRQADWVREFHRRAKAQRKAQIAAVATAAPAAAAATSAATAATTAATSVAAAGSQCGVASVDRELHSASVDGLWQHNRTATAAALESASASD